ncbi:glycosyltransferase family 2 protein [Sulfuricystis multivorans]|uniref:glycosyltransferase family 2 protein n=1 Tax=Sulfuricystis multivorans TaxID=2211108 RepID=UPI000F825A6F|nr:glycosyltransferase family 2 protein [Sulfuricystis multivorans]
MKLSIVVPCYNEEATIPVFLSTVTPIVQSTGLDYEIIFVDDGSRDTTVATIVALSNLYSKVRLVELSRNFGKEAAMTAGFSYATGDAIIPMDCDLQDPPELIPEMIAKWKAGFKVVHAVRRSRQTDTWLKRITASAFYRMMEGITDVAIPPNCGDYRLMDRTVVNAILSFPERNRFMKGIMAAAGFKATQVEYDRPERAAGETKFNFWKLWNFALDGITGFSTVPLRIWTYIGAIVALFSFSYAGWIIIKTIVWGVVTPGFATLTSVILFLGGIQLIGIGVLGEYIGRIVAETKRRPLFLVGALYGFEDRNTVVQLDAASADRGAL